MGACRLTDPIAGGIGADGSESAKSTGIKALMPTRHQGSYRGRGKTLAHQEPAS